MRRIAIVIGTMSDFGGAERVTACLANNMADLGLEIYLVSCHVDNSIESVYRLESNVNFINLNQSTSGNKMTRLLSETKQIRKFLEKYKPDAVIAMSSYGGVSCSLAGIGKKIPIVASERTDPWNMQKVSRTEKVLYRFIYRYVYRHLLAGAVFQTVSAKSYYYNIQDSRGVIIPNPLFLDNAPLPKHQATGSHKIISVGRLVASKNFPILLRAFSTVHKQYPQYTLTICGEGILREYMEALISELRLDNCVFMPGKISAIYDQYNQSDIFVMPSDFEGMSNALIEAMAMELPVVSTDNSGAAYLIESGVNGLLVPARNEEKLTEAMIFMIEHPEEAKRMGMEAAKVRDTLNAKKICSLWMSYLDGVVIKCSQ